MNDFIKETLLINDWEDMVLLVKHLEALLKICPQSQQISAVIVITENKPAFHKER